jgi:hypothetical protein
MFDFINAIITAIKDFFEGLFFPSSPEYQKKWQLKTYAAELRKLNPPLYRTGEILLPAFGALLYQLYHFLQPVKAILDKTVNSPDIRAAEKYRDIFFEAILSEEQVKQRRSFTFQERSILLSTCKSYQETEHKLQEQIHGFKNFMRIFTEPAFRTREQELIKLFFLSDLCDFDYAAFLNRFNNNLQLTAGTAAPISQDNFEEVFAKDVIKNLLDFQFIVRNVAITQTTIDNIIFLARSLENFTDETGVKLEKTLNTVETLLANRLKRTTIPIILKLINDDPNFEEKITVSESKPLQEYVDRMTENFQADSKRLLKITKETNITGLIEKCFGSGQLKPLDGYNDAINDAIQNLSTISFDWVKPMQLLKSFTEMYFETHYKTFLRSLLIEGFFANKQIEGQYAAIYRSCEMLLGKIKNFEQLFKPKGQCNLIEIQGYITEIEKGKDMKKQLQKIVEIANMQAKAVVQTGSKAYADLYAFTEHLLEDIKAPTPELITNLKALVVSSKNKESFTRLEQDRHIFAMFLEIMKNYAVFGSLEKGNPGGSVPTTVPDAAPVSKPV